MFMIFIPVLVLLAVAACFITGRLSELNEDYRMYYQDVNRFIDR